MGPHGFEYCGPPSCNIPRRGHAPEAVVICPALGRQESAGGGVVQGPVVRVVRLPRVRKIEHLDEAGEDVVLEHVGHRRAALVVPHVKFVNADPMMILDEFPNVKVLILSEHAGRDVCMRRILLGQLLRLPRVAKVFVLANMLRSASKSKACGA